MLDFKIKKIYLNFFNRSLNSYATTLNNPNALLYRVAASRSLMASGSCSIYTPLSRPSNGNLCNYILINKNIDFVALSGCQWWPE
jgi:hypothetical protein